MYFICANCKIIRDKKLQTTEILNYLWSQNNKWKLILSKGLRLSVASTAVCVCVCTVSNPVYGLCDNNGGYTEANWTCMAI